MDTRQTADPAVFSWRDPNRVNVSRSLIMMSIGAVVGLAVAGYGLFTAKGTTTFSVPPEDVALVNQQPVSRSDYNINLLSRFNASPAQATYDQRRKVLDDMIREELFVQRAKELDLASTDTDIRTAMVNAVEAGVATNVLTELPSQAKLRAYFDAHRATYSSEGIMTLRDLVFSRDVAAGAARALSQGASPDTVLADFKGRDSGKVNGEEFYFAAKIHLGEALFDQAVKLANGGVSALIPESDGVHILNMINNAPPIPLDFAKAYPTVLSDYRREATLRTQGSDADFLRKRANIQVAEDLR